MGIPPKKIDSELGRKVIQQLTSSITRLSENIKKQQITKPKPICNHSDGAIKVAEYIVQEIKKNVKSETADHIRYWIDSKEIAKRRKEWNDSPWYVRGFTDVPNPDLPQALIIWVGAVNTNHPWDHKPKIREKFKTIAVHRPTPAGVHSETYYHKYKKHDYFLDVWSNIHYGYVGLSVGFDEGLLLKGSDIQQFFHGLASFSFGGDTIDDETTMKIGFELYKKFGKYAENLTAQDVLSALESKPDNLLPVSRLSHWCWDKRNPNPAKEPTN